MWIVRSGRWRYDGRVEQPVDIVGLDFDYWHRLAEADGELDDGDEPTPLGPDGLLYYVRFRRAGDRSTPTWLDSPGFATLADAVREADRKAPTAIKWSWPRLRMFRRLRARRSPY